MNKLADFTLQALFVAGIVIISLAIYLTRIIGIQADDPQARIPVGPYDGFVTVYQFEQEERKIFTKISSLKVQYASDLLVFKNELSSIQNNDTLSSLEKREKISVLEGIYSTQYFQKILDLITQEQTILTKLREAKCLKYCNYQDLPVDV